MRIRTFLAVLFTLASLSTWGQNTDFLDYSVRRARLQPLMSHASLSICVYNVTDDTVLYALDADHALLPAALNKLFTTAAGFSRLGKDFRFKTQMVYSGTIDNRGVLHGNLYIIGQGDPFLGSARFPTPSSSKSPRTSATKASAASTAISIPTAPSTTTRLSTPHGNGTTLETTMAPASEASISTRTISMSTSRQARPWATP